VCASDVVKKKGERHERKPKEGVGVPTTFTDQVRERKKEELSRSHMKDDRTKKWSARGGEKICKRGAKPLRGLGVTTGQ